MKKKYIPFLLTLLFAQGQLMAQTDSTNIQPKLRLTTRTGWASVGHHHTYDKYLSSLLHQGTQIGLGFDEQRYYSASYPKFSKYDGMEFHGASDLNPAQNHRMLSFFARGFYGAHYHINAAKGLKIMPGAYSNLDLGLKYLAHNSNNPVNVIANTNLWLSVMGCYSFKIGKEPIRLSDHFSIAGVGLMFSPKYTQLYYDISAIDEFDGNFVFTSFGNRLHLRNEFAIDFPVARLATLRLGMVAERLKYNVNKLEGRNLDMSVKIGIVHNFYAFKGKETIPADFIKVLP